MKISIEHDSATPLMAGLATQMPDVVRRAVNSTAYKVRDHMAGEIVASFEQPVPFTVRGTRYTKATLTRLYATVEIDDERSTYLQPQIEGGAAEHQSPFEYALRRAGILTSTEHVVPGDAMRRNRYGNVSSGQYTKALSDLRANVLDPFQNRPERHTRPGRRKAARYWYDPNKRPRAIWTKRKRGAAPSPAWIIVDTPVYRQRFDFEGAAQRFAKHFYRAQFDRSVRFEAAKQAGLI